MPDFVELWRYPTPMGTLHSIYFCVACGATGSFLCDDCEVGSKDVLTDENILGEIKNAVPGQFTWRLKPEDLVKCVVAVDDDLPPDLKAEDYFQISPDDELEPADVEILTDEDRRALEALGDDLVDRLIVSEDSSDPSMKPLPPDILAEISEHNRVLREEKDWDDEPFGDFVTVPEKM